MIDDQVLVSNPNTGFPDFLLDDGYMNAMLCAEEAELMRALGDPLFDNISGGGGEFSGSDDTLDNKLNEKAVVIAAQAAAGWQRGGLKRAAFSMNDLTALQPNQGNGRGMVKRENKTKGRRGSKKLGKLKSLDENKPMKGEELSSLGILDQPDPMMPNMHYPAMHGNSQFQDSQQVMMPPHSVQAQGGHQWNNQFPPPMYPPQNDPAAAAAVHQQHQQQHQPPMHMAPSFDQQPDPSSAAAHAAPRTMPMQQHMYGQQMQAAPQQGPPGHASGPGGPHKMNGQMHFHQPLHGHMNGTSGSSALRRVASSPNFSKHLENATKKEVAPDAPATNGDGRARIGTLTLEERRARILRYRQKRHERNFRKRIKYNCRKTLADSRPRIRGRFARNDEIEELLKQKKLQEQGKSDSGSSSQKTDEKQSSDNDKEVKSAVKA